MTVGRLVLLLILSLTIHSKEVRVVRINDLLADCEMPSQTEYFKSMAAWMTIPVAMTRQTQHDDSKHMRGDSSK
ncbi:hypothetical protein CRM22_004878 [Opisthorchis felineus]|uniref:Uncharacterized protein n=1 Tax=Opisthorchis felineus TaxID=147828 RepID=A0A4V3SF61_OPIFE|nr:hypothetical protein CRM22_004878 [Opisthorchis felineus]